MTHCFRLWIVAREQAGLDAMPSSRVGTENSMVQWCFSTASSTVSGLTRGTRTMRVSLSIGSSREPTIPKI